MKFFNLGYFFLYLLSIFDVFVNESVIFKGTKTTGVKSLEQQKCQTYRKFGRFLEEGIDKRVRNGAGLDQ